MSGASTSGRGLPPVGSSFFSRHKRSIVSTGVCAAALYALYRYHYYKSPSSITGEEGQRRPISSLGKYLRAFEGYATAAAAASGTASSLAVDLQAYLSGDCEQLPASLRQLGRLLESEEVQGVLRTSASTLAEGMARGVSSIAAATQAGEILC